ncbi:disulfide bond formation protein B (plasmid) [Paracoccus versutus]|uniref:Disulfide bond formation protein DsbB n=1 Tax=Paracoccus versutus TaxID=34007 RepID=A0A099FLP9_PARVE|nr:MULTISPECIES: disulfide bond formation protein B [Paracoccus]WGR62842.1 disulfide bond formation protein B [Paracoccus ferrooxidans]SFY15783.1 Disulfide bond formation protein DsbB [Paracoccus pantotrophus]KGJ11226.1 dihydroneopterin aldolase [Paracoccus versutus]MBT0781162.1 disulfide bond formation protein B [Paracoccus sp. pheM1]MCJ1901821.1 disulfide bond formation protein B [Paracoccus versutus]
MNGFSSKHVAVTAGAGSAALLAAALTFQALGYAPCELCILQRWPHLVAAIIGGLIWFFGWKRWLAALGLLAALCATGLAIYHAGVELQVWQGPQHCSGGVSGLASMSTQDLMAALEKAPVVRCDEVAWSLFGISMAGWNAILSAGLSALWLASVRGRRREAGLA